MPWEPSYSCEEAANALRRSTTWAEALRQLGISPLGKNFATIRKWADRWGLDVSHLPGRRPARTGPSFTEEQAREAIRGSLSWAEALRKLDYCPSGGNPRTLKKWAAVWGISTAHFDPRAAVGGRPGSPLEVILVRGSTFSRSHLKERLYAEGLKQRVCEWCGQGEEWHGKSMGLILDHANGVRDDNRIENLRILCPNCAATLETHCGRNKPKAPPRTCAHCGTNFRAKYRDHRYCTRTCAGLAEACAFRTVERPPYAQLLQEIDELGYLAVGRKYGVSDNAVRKWVRFYERERAIAEGRDPDAVEIPRRTWPNRRRGGANDAQARAGAGAARR